MLFAEKISKMQEYEEKDHNLKIIIFNSIGQIYRHLKNFKNAIIFHSQAV